MPPIQSRIRGLSLNCPFLIMNFRTDWTEANCLTGNSFLVSLVYCGRGDKKTKRGKRFKHSYGNVSPTSPYLSLVSAVIRHPFLHSSLSDLARRGHVTRRRELAPRGSTPLQHLPGRTSSMTGRSFRSRSMRTSWNRLSEMHYVLSLPWA
jgi:ribosomal small subunit protein bTHX